MKLITLGAAAARVTQVGQVGAPSGRRSPIVNHSRPRLLVGSLGLEAEAAEVVADEHAAVVTVGRRSNRNDRDGVFDGADVDIHVLDHRRAEFSTD